VRPSSAMADALALVAPGQPLRDGIERILQANRGLLLVVGDGPDVLSICTGGFLLDAEFSPQRLSELAKMDGAVILSPDADRIARANVHLMPNATIPTIETGTRHRTAERVARSIDVPVVSVSAAMGLVTVYRHDTRHVLQDERRLHERVRQALQTTRRFRQRFDSTLSALSALEIADTVTVRDVVAVVQPAELLDRIADTSRSTSWSWARTDASSASSSRRCSTASTRCAASSCATTCTASTTPSARARRGPHRRHGLAPF